MIKAKLIDDLATATQQSKRDAEQQVEAMLAAIAEALARSEKVEFRGFGSFQVSAKKERQGRNPRTGEAILIPARKAAVFKPSKELTERINGTAAADEGQEPATLDNLPTAQPSDAPAKLHGDKLDG